MAIKGVSLAEREDFILPHDPGHKDHPDFKAAVKAGKETDKPTVFQVGVLTQGCRIELGDMTTSPTMRDGGVTMEMRRTKRAYAVVQRGLRGWSNMLDHEGKVAKFEETTLSTANGFIKGAAEASMGLLSSEDIFALSLFILEKNGLSKATEGNSEGASPQALDLPLMDGSAAIAPTTKSESEVAPK